MKAGIVFTGTGPILILTSYASLSDPNLAAKLARKGVMKFIAHELDPALVKARYGKQFEAISDELKRADDMRVLDYNGHNVFYNFAFEEMGPAIYRQ
ncbi:conserved hypothetical protein [Desulfarculus baarsii DSM 2075]|uniref:Uncharacterized protein n=1 Tax=Desulfarculus baarsii (strain ATCC 33931 / DSM 2075 / LMG 7858 / VKM B-1802 / 2st14) TaxID=644282 RepID=E1QHQ9_DESB2|nr:hypothetical protein [Desulfarculus baarsii]ADK85102.1 conserved hypothetical protein [Desulfarculus baarsii DSM 2075]